MSQISSAKYFEKLHCFTEEAETSEIEPDGLNKSVVYTKNKKRKKMRQETFLYN